MRNFSRLNRFRLPLALMFLACPAAAQPVSPASTFSPPPMATAPATDQTPMAGAQPAVSAQAPGAAAPGNAVAAAAAAPIDPGLADFLGAQTKLRTLDGAPEADESLFFTPWQHALLQESKRGFLTRPASAGAGGADAASRPPAIREISLGGIVYRAPKDWTIYLNNQRVTPDALPDQVLDLKVFDDNVRLKWFDTATNLIFPIVLRANQRFNLDARMFLPGVGGPVPVKAP